MSNARMDCDFRDGIVGYHEQQGGWIQCKLVRIVTVHKSKGCIRVFHEL